MGEFPESVKREVIERAGFQCCVCRRFGGVQAHHIRPAKDGGPDTIDNAAPLCPNCHDTLGDNPKKRKEITQTRDWWYAQVEKMCGGVGGVELLSQIDDRLERISQNQDTQSAELAEFKNMLHSIADKMINSITPATAASTASGIVNASAASSVRLGENLHANVICQHCNTRIGLLVGRNSCPGCGAELQ